MKPNRANKRKPVEFKPVTKIAPTLRPTALAFFISQAIFEARREAELDRAMIRRYSK